MSLQYCVMELLDYQAIGGKSERLGWMSEGEPVHEIKVIPGLQNAALDFTGKPDAHGMLGGVMKVAMHGQHVAYGDLQACFFQTFTIGRLADVFIPLHMTTGDAPGAGIGALGSTSSQQDASFGLNDGGDAHCRVAVVDKAASGASHAYASPFFDGTQRCGAMGAKAIGIRAVRALYCSAKAGD